MSIKYYVLVIFGSVLPYILAAQSHFSFQEQTVAPGTHQKFKISLSDGKDSTFIPVSVFHGSRPGPVLGITAGVHGYEYAPILAAQRIAQQIDPTTLSGTVILVHLANLPSFLGRSPYVNPLDEKNLNRVFPGRADGSLTEQMAYQLTREVIARSDYFLDMHSGDAPEDLRPYVGYYSAERFPEASRTGKAMALALGFEHIIVFDVAAERIDEPSLYCSQEAFFRQIPSADIECGRLGAVQTQDVQAIVGGVTNLLRHLKMMEGKVVSLNSPLFIRERPSVISPQDGIFYPLKTSGEYVSEGMKVGYITDFFGENPVGVFASAPGIILYIIGTPPIKQGETLLRIGRIPTAKNAN
ncbi:putative deacylase [Catalinimonas alkaloidigena]|uniref:succinylglutamate desuccinylase/aspartoacylase family protein n=1 Tax=Catalinimonas alkaloidigena TaxID=1075417 RepID=UPI002404EA57|nr:M14 family metallopeptidase [Catalinimonas alkaloidigena]MDF9797844.1 putative deacylase [Catalinimonas alkaloidigena]